MAYKIITDKCEGAAACVTVCPTDSIHPDAANPGKYAIDPDTCIDCGACMAECPNEAIEPG